MKNYNRYINSLTGLILLFGLIAIMAVWADVGASPDEAQVVEVPVLPATLHEYANINLPPYFNQQPLVGYDTTPGNNPITNEGATLGRVLFYDKNLSANNTVACASCHIQEFGFSDPNQFSIGFDGGLTGRNSMGLSNARYYENLAFFWDERAATLEDQVLQPIQNEVEMGLTLTELVEKVDAQSYYDDLFMDAFGSTEVTTERISLALAQFVRSMVSYQSKYDEGLATGFANFTPQENLGRQLFNDPGRGNCAGCHTTDAHVATEARNIGLDLVYADNGVGDVTGNPADNGLFKVPSLRNIEVTGPYMHDGRFDTLQEVIDHYSNNIENHPNLSPQLRLPGPPPPPGAPPPPARMPNFNQTERNALEAFMLTLTDNDLLTDEKFSDPFVTAGEINGIVYLQARTNHTGIAIELWSGATLVDSTITATDGSYTLSALAGTYDVRVSMSGFVGSEKNNVVLTQGGTVTLATLTLLGGDIDGNGIITISDISAVTASFGASCGEANWNASADLNQDCMITIQDLTLLTGNFGASYPLNWD